MVQAFSEFCFTYRDETIKESALRYKVGHWYRGTSTSRWQAHLINFQALNISYFLLTFSKDPPKEKPKEEKPAPYGKEKPKKEKPKEEKPKDEKQNYATEEPPKVNNAVVFYLSTHSF